MGTAALHVGGVLALLLTSPSAAPASERGRGFTVGGATSLGTEVASGPSRNVSRRLHRERRDAEASWSRGEGNLWFQHFRRAGGTTMCELLSRGVPLATFAPGSDACQPGDFRLRDAFAMCERNMSVVSAELDVLGGNALAQEYGPLPGPALLGRSEALAGGGNRLRRWVFVTTMRDPWSRLWSQLQYEMATCLTHVQYLAMCMGGHFKELGHWWSPTAHVDSILGIPGSGISDSPAIYVDNYYTRVLLNRTDVSGPKLTQADLEDAKMLLRERISTVVILEDFARSALQLACTIGLDVERARPMLRTRVRPYEAHEQLMEVPDKAQFYEALGGMNMDGLKQRFAKRNRFDFLLYGYAVRLARQRLAACARRHPSVRAILKEPPETFREDAPPSKPQEGDPLPPELSVDDLFGCTGGSITWDEKAQAYQLHCPRSAAQHATSWWQSSTTDGHDMPKRKRGQRLPGAECWASGFTWGACCAPRFGEGGNKDCWGEGYTYAKCCAAAAAA